LYIQEPACCSGFKWSFGFQHSKPASLSGVPSDKWSAFQSSVHDQASAIKNNEMLFLGFIPFWLLAIVVRDVGFILSIVGFALLVGGSFMIINQNQQKDIKIKELCDQFGAETGITLQYYTQYTGFCKPKGAQTVRAIIITSSVPATIGAVVGAPVGTTMMSVQVPPGAQAGQTLQIQTASGPMNVVVPQGMAEGQSFQVHVPAGPQIPTVQATPVQAIPTVQATPVTPEAN